MLYSKILFVNKMSESLIVCACTKCMKYVVIYEDYLSSNKVKLFKAEHSGHPVVNTVLSDIDKRYISDDAKYLDRINCAKI